jgi:hypothetical protein
MISTIFLGLLKDAMRVRVLENGPDNIRTALKLAREVELILGDTTKKPKGSTIVSLQDLNEKKAKDIVGTISLSQTNISQPLLSLPYISQPYKLIPTSTIEM